MRHTGKDYGRLLHDRRCCNKENQQQTVLQKKSFGPDPITAFVDCGVEFENPG